MDPNLLFMAGILSIPAYLLLNSIWFKLGLLVFFFILSRFNQKKIKPLYFAVLSFFIILFELMIPAGKILITAGPLKITAGALQRGVLKASTLVGLVLISLSTIRKDIRIPGGAGILFAKTFYYFEKLLQSKDRIRAKQFIPSIDKVLFSLYPDKSAEEIELQPFRKPGLPAVLISLAIAAVPWVCLFLSKL